jgi:hypothetical protein
MPAIRAGIFENNGGLRGGHAWPNGNVINKLQQKIGRANAKGGPDWTVYFFRADFIAG